MSVFIWITPVNVNCQIFAYIRFINFLFTSFLPTFRGIHVLFHADHSLLHTQEEREREKIKICRYRLRHYNFLTQILLAGR